MRREPECARRLLPVQLYLFCLDVVPLSRAAGSARAHNFISLLQYRVQAKSWRATHRNVAAHTVGPRGFVPDSSISVLALEILHSGVRERPSMLAEDQMARAIGFGAV